MGESGSYSDEGDPDPADRLGVEVPIRMCDYVAFRLWEFDGAPECLLTWPEPRRDQAVAACAEYLRRYGPTLRRRISSGRSRRAGTGSPACDFPALDRPATPDDVREGRAVFSAAGEGEARVVKLPSGFPVRAAGSPSRTCDSTAAGPAAAGRTGPRSAPGWLGLAGGGSVQGRPLGTIVRLRRPRDDRPRGGLGGRVLARPESGAEPAQRALATDRAGRQLCSQFPAGAADQGRAATLQCSWDRGLGADRVSPRRVRRQTGPAPGGVAGAERRFPGEKTAQVSSGRP